MKVFGHLAHFFSSSPTPTLDDDGGIAFEARARRSRRAVGNFKASPQGRRGSLALSLSFALSNHTLSARTLRDGLRQPSFSRNPITTKVSAPPVPNRLHTSFHKSPGSKSSTNKHTPRPASRISSQVLSFIYGRLAVVRSRFFFSFVLFFFQRKNTSRPGCYPSYLFNVYLFYSAVNANVFECA
ncbi:hypothetical protein RB195_008055 [Necator americanus]|uniref:Uncharacterized protein n=1 Tax=Necator americanus TaxID=51031 RepID=A0ABR1C2J0_NECAM